MTPTDSTPTAATCGSRSHHSPAPRLAHAGAASRLPRLDPTVSQLHADARRIVKSDDLAWDVVQETLIRDDRRHPGERSPLPALRKLCSLVSLSVLRARDRREYHEGAACSAAAHAEVVDPAVAAQQSELSSLLTDALRTLPVDQRRPFELFEFEGHSYECIAEQLELPIGTVRSRIARARAGLRDVLERTAPAYTRELAS